MLASLFPLKILFTVRSIIIAFFFSKLLKTPADLEAEGDDVDYETEHDARRRKLNAEDVVHAVDLRQAFQSQMSALAQTVGPNKFKEIIDEVDVETLDNMKEYIEV